MFQYHFFSESVMQELRDTHLRITRGGGDGVVGGGEGVGLNPAAHRGVDEVHQDEQHHHGVQFDEDGLVVPKKLFNPCKESRECQNLHREIRWNAKA